MEVFPLKGIKFSNFSILGIVGGFIGTCAGCLCCMCLLKMSEDADKHNNPICFMFAVAGVVSIPVGLVTGTLIGATIGNIHLVLISWYKLNLIPGGVSGSSTLMISHYL